MPRLFRNTALAVALFLGVCTPVVFADPLRQHRSPCAIHYPSDDTVEWECRTLQRGESLEKLFGEQWSDVARFNRIDRRHAVPGVAVKVPRSLDALAHAFGQRFDVLEQRVAAAEQRVAAIESRGALDAKAVASELLAKGSAAGINGPPGPPGPRAPPPPAGAPPPPRGPAWASDRLVPAIIVALVITLLLVKGTSESAKVNAVLVAVKVTALSAFIVITLPLINGENFTPMLPNGWLGTQGSGVGVVGAAASIFFAYVGFDAVSTAAEETKDPQSKVEK